MAQDNSGKTELSTDWPQIATLLTIGEKTELQLSKFESDTQNRLTRFIRKIRATLDGDFLMQARTYLELL